MGHKKREKENDLYVNNFARKNDVANADEHDSGHHKLNELCVREEVMQWRCGFVGSLLMLAIATIHFLSLASTSSSRVVEKKRQSLRRFQMRQQVTILLLSLVGGARAIEDYEMVQTSRLAETAAGAATHWRWLKRLCRLAGKDKVNCGERKCQANTRVIEKLDHDSTRVQCAAVHRFYLSEMDSNCGTLYTKSIHPTAGAA